METLYKAIIVPHEIKHFCYSPSYFHCEKNGCKCEGKGYWTTGPYLPHADTRVYFHKNGPISLKKSHDRCCDIVVKILKNPQW